MKNDEKGCGCYHSKNEDEGKTTNEHGRLACPERAYTAGWSFTNHDYYDGETEYRGIEIRTGDE